MSRAQGPRVLRSGALGRFVASWSRLAAAGVAVVGIAYALSWPVGGGASAAPAGQPARWTWELTAGFPPPRVPADNPMSRRKVALGRFLFYEKRLSANRAQSCGSCHVQSLAFTDGRAQAIGSTGQVHPRSSQSLANVGYHATLTWANPTLVSLERQMETVIFGDRPVEFGVTDRTKRAVLARIARDPRYRRMFAAAFPAAKPRVSWVNVIKAIASFERTLISGNSTYDRYLRGRAELDASETRGKDLFFGERAECSHCHTSFNFNDQAVYAGSRPAPRLFHNTGLYNIGGTGAFPVPNRGLFEFTSRPADMGRFRAPSLRNVGVTAPYMHDGSIATLEEVVAFYAAGGRNITEGPNAGDGRLSPFRSSLISAISLTPQDQADIVAFLRTLTDRRFLTDARLSDPFARRTGG
ncbi:MAG: di-heme enzyme [Thermoleophilia bacterium]|nr:di-heme enzyme [Thermoleophilia bacterium]